MGINDRPDFDFDRPPPEVTACRRPGFVGGLERQAAEQDADAYAPDPQGPEGGA